ncbi:MAG TPA: sensor histidine kinase, partial [Anaerolineales bacterium]|nr:sensor histidine kinase [Anaerolineales bacterium]
RTTDERLRTALRPLAAFGILHGSHEWLEVFLVLDALPFIHAANLLYEALRLAILAFSFLSLSAFGASLLSPTLKIRRLSLLLPLTQGAIWGFGSLILKNHFTLEAGLFDTADVWSRYILGVPSSLVASAGLIAQQRAFRQAGMAQFGRDSLWAAIAFAWYGVVGQIFTRVSPLPPSDFLNQNLFLSLFGFPVQVLRAVAAGAAAAFVIRFLRASEVEKQRQIAALQEARLQEAEQRETLRGEMLRRIVAAQEAERQRIARELHDETGQSLTAIGLGLRGLTNALANKSNHAAQNLRRLEGLISQSLTELQRLIADLRPSHLDDLGLPAALRWYAGEVQQRTMLEVQVQIQGEERSLPAPVKIALFRVAQEALNNVVKHAAAASVFLQLAYGDQEVSIRIEDDGKGFMIENLNQQNRPTWGLMGMRERAALLGGGVTFQSQPGSGTVVEVVIPYQQGEPAPLNENPNENTPLTRG